MKPYSIRIFFELISTRKLLNQLQCNNIIVTVVIIAVGIKEVESQVTYYIGDPEKIT